MLFDFLELQRDTFFIALVGSFRAVVVCILFGTCKLIGS